MKQIVKLGLAAALAFGASTAVLAQATVDYGGDASGKAATDIKVKPNNMGANAAGSVDATTTGSVNTNYGQLISNLQTSGDVDVSGLASASDVNCVMVSSLKGDANGNAQALDNALSKNQSNIASLQGKFDASLLSKVETSCDVADVTGFSAKNIIGVETGADGAYTLYIDDRNVGASGGTSTTTNSSLSSPSS
jgi:hypothetical protein